MKTLSRWTGVAMWLAVCCALLASACGDKSDGGEASDDGNGTSTSGTDDDTLDGTQSGADSASTSDPEGTDTDFPPGSSMGPGTPQQYEPTGDNSNGVGVDDDGWLELNDEQFGLNHLWVPNSAEGTVSKIDTVEVLETGRYNVGMNENRADPSRTSVDLAGDVFVGNRCVHNASGVPSVTKIAAQKARCVDRNGNGSIETSSGPADVLPRSDGTFAPAGQSSDECVVWNRGFDPADPDALPGIAGCSKLRAVAATYEVGESFEFNGHVWVGCFDQQTVYKLNGKSGDLMAEHKIEGCSPYGFVLDKDARLWTSCRDVGHTGLTWMDTLSGAATYMEPGGTGPVLNPYGIGIDIQGRIWMTSHGDGSVYRYTPGPAADLGDGVWESLKVTDNLRGIAVDEDGFVWAMDTSGDAEIYLIDGSLFPDPSSLLGSTYIGDDKDGGTTACWEGTGVAIDFRGQVWGVSKNGDQNGCATRLNVNRTGAVPVIEGKDVLVVGRGPYVYSDMLGYNLHHFATQEGWYRQVFEVCDDHSTKWQKISWQADVPSGARVVIRARTANFLNKLDTKQWTTIVEVPSDVAPKDMPVDLPEGHFIELEVRLYASPEGHSPAVGAIGFGFSCTGVII